MIEQPWVGARRERGSISPPSDGSWTTCPCPPKSPCRRVGTRSVHDGRRPRHTAPTPPALPSWRGLWPSCQPVWVDATAGAAPARAEVARRVGAAGGPPEAPAGGARMPSPTPRRERLLSNPVDESGFRPTSPDECGIRPTASRSMWAEARLNGAAGGELSGRVAHWSGLAGPMALSSSSARAKCAEAPLDGAAGGAPTPQPQAQPRRERLLSNPAEESAFRPTSPDECGIRPTASGSMCAGAPLDGAAGRPIETQPQPGREHPTAESALRPTSPDECGVRPARPDVY
jgi:hypothetical protein